MLLVGIGNSLRSDDGAGIVAAERLHHVWQRSAHPHRLLTVHQLLPELAEELADPLVETVLFVDAAANMTGQHQAGQPDIESDGTAGGYYLYPVAPGEGAESFSHHVSPAMLLAYADVLYAKRPHAWVLALPGATFELGSKFSEQITTALDQVEAAAVQIWEVVWREVNE